MNIGIRAVAMAAAVGVASIHVIFAADVLRPRASFAPRFEKAGGNFHAVVAAPDGGYFVAGNFSSLDGVARTGVAKFSANGALDPAFAPPDIAGGAVHALALQGDGKLIVGGSFRSIGSTPRGGIARLTTTGALDPAFAEGPGVANTDRILSFAIQSDGRILVGGSFSGIHGNAGRGIARLLADGSADPSFVAPDFSPYEINAIAVRSDGRIFVGGSFFVPGIFQQPAVHRLLANGALDPGFATGSGFLSTASYHAIHALLVDANNRVIVGGGFNTYDGTARVGLARLNDDGALDPTFNAGTGFTGGQSSDATLSGVTALARQPDGAILVAGVFMSANGTPRGHIARLTVEGALDLTFDPQESGGPAQFTSGALRSVTVLTSGAIVAAGNFFQNLDLNVPRVFKFSATGAVDAAVNPVPRTPGIVRALVRDTQARFIAGGDFTHVNGQPRGRIARLAADGTLDANYAAGANDGFNRIVTTLALAAGDSVYAGGEFDRWGTTESGRIARLTSAGALDPAFAVGSGFNYPPHGLYVLSDGRVLAHGQFTQYQFVDRTRLARLESNGALDPTFTVGDLFSGYDAAVLEQADGRIVIGAHFQVTTAFTRAGLARFHANGTLDATFGGGAGGFYTVQRVSDVPAAVAHLALAPGGAIYALGSFTYHIANGTKTPVTQMARLSADGVLDPTFNAGEGISSGGVNAVLVQADGKLVIGGTFTTVQAAHVNALARLLPTGVRDPSFQLPPILPGAWPGGAPTDVVHALVPGDGDLPVAAGTWLRFVDFAAGGAVQFEAAPGPQIVTTPQEQIAQPGDDVTFTVSATGDNLRYQWFRDGDLIVGATGASLALDDVDWHDGGAYTVAVSNDYATVTAGPALLRGPNPLPVITTHPGTADVVAGQSTSLAVAATSTGPLTYRWRFNGAEVAGAPGATLTRANAALTDAGWYDVVVADGMSVATSRAGRVVVRPARYGNAYRAVPAFAPRFESDGGLLTRAAAAPDGTFYVGGRFSSLDEHPRSNLARFLADGTIDPGFVPPDLGEYAVSAILPTAGGKVLVGGSFDQAGAVTSPRLVRLNANGTVDTSFDVGSGFLGDVVTLAQDASGRVIAGGYFSAVDGLPRNRIVRLLADGSVDPTFVIGSGFDGNVTTLAVDADGRILAGGQFNNYNGSARARLARLLPDGALDTTFAPGTNNLSSVSAITPLPDGRVLVGAFYYLARLNANGTIDPTFDAGIAFDNDVQSIFPLGDGRLIVAGRYYSGSSYVGPVVRLTSSGARDPTFVPPPSLAGISPRSAARLADGQIVLVIAGTLASTPPPYRSVVLLGADGALNPDFAPAMRLPSTVSHAVPTAEGKWIVGGAFNYLNGVPVGRFARLHADGSVDATFASGSGFNNGINTLVPGAGGALYVGGPFTTYDGSLAPGLVRLHADGTRDPGFDASAAALDQVRAIALRPDGRVWVGGAFASLGPRPGSITRLHRDGTVDTTFAAGIGLRHSYSIGYPFPGTGVQNGSVAALLPTAEGDILVAGGFSSYAGIARHGIARFRANGELDLGFDPGAGFRGLIGFTTGSGWVSALELLPDGRLLAGGEFNSYDNTSVSNLVRLESTGARDSTFNSATSPNVNLLPQSDGKVIVAGSGAPGRTVLMRLTTTGAPDPTFSVTDSPADYLAVRPLTFRADGAILAGGDSIRFGNFTAHGLVLLVPDDPPVINTAPQAQTTTAGGATTLSVAASSNGPVTYQWQQLVSDNAPLGATPAADTWVDITGAMGASYTIPSTQTFHGGTYRVIVSAGGASVASDPVVVTVSAAAPSNSRLLNLSTRGLSAVAPDVLIPGFVISGSANKRLLIRAVGPTLALDPINLAGTLISDPVLTLKKFNTGANAYEDLASNDDWGTNTNAAEIGLVAADLFAFELKDAKEAALLMNLEPGQYTAIASDKTNATGLAIVELYDADPAGAGPASTLVNISNRGYAGVGDQVMIPGFVVSPEGPKTVLVRVVGPTLANDPYNVPGTMTDPQLTIYSGQTAILANDNWGDNPDAANTAAVAQQVGAFPLASGSADAAFVVTLTPGVYTVVGSSADGAGTGIVLVEVYVVP